MNTTHTTIAPTCSHQQSALNLRIMFNCLIAALLLALSAIAHNPAAAQSSPEAYGQNDDIVDRSWPPANPRGSHNSTGNNNSSRDKRHLDNNILQNTGTWHQHPRWGNVWRPNHNRYWRPYTIGRWKSDTNDSWQWVSSEPFGKLVFHYGQWTVDPDLRWIWVPGSTWAPAWVKWRTNADYVGWAPLPPGSPRSGRAQPHKTEFYDDDLFEDDWVFVRRSGLTSRDLNRIILPRDDNIDLIDITSPARDPNQFASRGAHPRYNQPGFEFPSDIYRDDPYEDDAFDDGPERLEARTVVPWGTPSPQPRIRGPRPPRHAPDHARPRTRSPHIQATRRAKKKQARAQRVKLRKKAQRTKAKSKRLKRQVTRSAAKAKSKTEKRRKRKLATRTAKPVVKPSAPTHTPQKHTFAPDTNQPKQPLNADAKIEKQAVRPPPRKPKLKPAPTAKSTTGTVAPKTQRHATKKIRVKRTGAPVSPVVLNARPKAKPKKRQAKERKIKKAKRGKSPKKAKKPANRKKKTRRDSETQPSQG